jgi:crossover junction endodeoxyribonuclease RuvC
MPTSNSSTIIMGIDPGYDRMGWAIGKCDNRNVDLIEYGCIQTNKKLDIFERYQQLINELEEIISKHKPSETAIETLFFSKNKTTAMRVSEARGVIISCCISGNSTVFEYHPQQIKQAVTGNGGATKAQVEKMVRLQTKLPAKSLIDDTIDAIAITITHAASRSGIVHNR